MKTKSPCINYMQYGGGYSIWRRHIINKVEDAHYRCVTRSVWRRGIIDTEEGVQYRTTKTAQGGVGGCIYLGKMIFYRHSEYNPDFILLWLNPDFESPTLLCFLVWSISPQQRKIIKFCGVIVFHFYHRST